MAGRGRSREPRGDGDGDDGSDSFDSYASFDDDDSYEPDSERHLELNESTEYESDGSEDESYSDASDDDDLQIPSEYETDDCETDDNANKGSGADGRVHFGDEDQFHSNNIDDDDSESDDDDDDGNDVPLGEQDDDLFWKRYGYSQGPGNFQESPGTNPHGDEESSHNSEEDDDDDGSEFDDGDTFKDELYSKAFPSIAAFAHDDLSMKKADNKKRFGGGDGGFVERLKNSLKCCSCCNFSLDFLQGNFKWYLLAAVIFIVTGAVLAFVLPKKDTTNPGSNPSLPPTVAPLVTAPPTLPPGQVSESITFFAQILNAKEEGIFEEELEVELSTAFDILAPQVLLNATEPDVQENTTVVVQKEIVNESTEEGGNNLIRLRGRNRQRRVQASVYVKVPVSVDVVEIVCPDTVPFDEFDMCVRVTATIIVVTDDGNIGFDYFSAMEDAIEVGQLQEASDTSGSNLTFVTLDKEDIVTPSPTTTASPTNSPRPTASFSPTSSCYDKESNCVDWANQNPSECDANPEYMSFYCTKACGLCQTEPPATEAPTISPTASPVSVPTPASTNLPTVSSIGTSSVEPTQNDISVQSPTSSPCVDKDDGCAEFSDNEICIVTNCKFWASQGECIANASFMLDNCAESCNNCGTDLPTASPMSVDDSEKDSYPPAPTLAPTGDACVDENARCKIWAADDQCSSNPEYMLQSCKLSCDVCGNESDNEKPPPSPSCSDDNTRCPIWAADDQCTSNPSYMLQSCKLSCSVCGNEASGGSSETQPPGCVDDNTRCAEWAADNQCSINPTYMKENCKFSCNVCGNEIGGEFSETLPPGCTDDNTRCAEWAADNQCSVNPTYMLQNCKASCSACGGASTCQDSKKDCYESSDSGECLVTKCAFWAQEGECEANPTFMLTNCSRSCGQCADDN